MPPFLAALFAKVSLKWVLAGLAALTIGAAAWASLSYVRGLTERLAAEHAARIVAEARAAGMRAEWQRLVEQQRREAALLAEAERRRDAAEAAQREAAALLAKHDLGKIAHEKPSLLDRHLNRAGDRVECLLERASGADRACAGAAGEGGAAPAGAAQPRAAPVADPAGR